MTIRRTVKRVIDGDTFEVARKIQGTNRIRIAGLNAPELKQKGGSEAANKLRRLIGSKQVTIVPVSRSYNRLVAHVRRNRKKIR
ncbi:MAG: thermonuclease family protein [Nanoarchaeota archaeon]|nr:thermonuclease family protein [Nanoarchaeota archaeon]MBU4283718.1 thermonuclease family protein [Nanoarchaeota archaeon]